MLKDIPGYEGKYAATEDGHIYSYCSMRLLNENYDKWGYKKVTLTENNQRAGRLVHKLVAMAFIPNPENRPHVEHINGGILDNRVENLQWTTLAERSKHRPYHSNGVVAAANARSKGVVMCDAKDHNKEIREFASSSEAARVMFDDVSKNSLINRCANGKSPGAYGYFWRWKKH